jgi:uncharacterized membrane protein YfcA
MLIITGFVMLGLAAGALSGLIGIGGGILIVPALVFLFGYSQQMAQGTTLALLIPPIGILAAITYFKAGYVDMKAAGFICAGFIVGALFGSRFAVSLTGNSLQKTFGVCLFLISIKMMLGK